MHNQDYDVIIKPQRLKGQVVAPPSKSVSHRAIICAGLCEAPSIIENIAYSEDIKATLEAMKPFGTNVEELGFEEGRVRLRIHNPKMRDYYREHIKPVHQNTEIYCHESGSTARFMIPLFHLSESEVVFTGSKRLSERPYQPYYQIFEKQGIIFNTANGGLPLSVKGSLKPDQYHVVGNISSQFISGLMFVLPLLEGDSEIIIQPPLESRDYVDLTVACLERFGIHFELKSELHYMLRGNQSYKAADYSVEGDYSQAAFWLVAARIGNAVEVTGLEPNSKQADRAILKILECQDVQKETSIDVSQFPDLVPILAVFCALTPGHWKIVNAGRLRIKESDRLKAIATELSKMGARISELEDGLEIIGVSKLRGAVVDSWNDHRIAMALAIAATCADGETLIIGAHCVRKSYPDFWSVYQSLGGHIDVK